MTKLLKKTLESLNAEIVDIDATTITKEENFNRFSSNSVKNVVVVEDSKIDSIRKGDAVTYRDREVTVKSISDNGWIRLSDGSSIRGIGSLTNRPIRHIKYHRLATQHELNVILGELLKGGVLRIILNLKAIRLISFLVVNMR